ncbi:hypothetical protein [Lysinibacillus sphaericus]|uniref:Uncharacterized protein n=1 Tax=Lysinibacillus sphaericus (strain C3-41) TaxID=444177 RepID=B1I0E1_LYSSC|nr:hypothetical protein [Lysinibacillus sphaericus]MBE5085690.1 hypothetical protein [Bacillus thuringiensis]ACA42300.1 hypothetical protein Bsph_p070 [Lysinibacillus sphaericus C3-41]AMO35443.1 hypothetical protein AR327_23415 [Lysinibacillus sphaericus]AMR93124.1 hypothetical protein A1T07_23240 [Lysinibacillus sphaericus]MBG9710694.1 hypothetical protein [Lysinibacillus sphaericus]
MEDQLMLFDIDSFATSQKTVVEEVINEVVVTTNPLGNLMERLNAVEITTDNRISEIELDYCKKIEAVYLDSKQVLEDVLSSLTTVFDRQKNVKINGKDLYYLSEFEDIYYVEKRLTYIYRRFVSDITCFFAQRHNVTISSDDIKKKYSYETITYSLIVDEIFEQLGGLNFKEKAIEEIKTNSRKIVYQKDRIIVSRNKMSIDDLIWWNSYAYDGGKELDYSDSNLRSLFIALSHFIGNKETMLKELENIYAALRIGDKHYDIFSKYEINIGCLVSFKVFKNRKVELVFSDNTSAEAFKNEYLL